MSVCAEHGPESRYLADGTNVGHCTECAQERSYWGDSVRCGACYVGKLHTLTAHDARVAGFMKRATA